MYQIGLTCGDKNCSLKKPQKNIKLKRSRMTLVTPLEFPIRSWGAGLQYWGTGLSLRNLDLWWDSPRLIAGTSAGRRPATVGMCSLMSGAVQQ